MKGSASLPARKKALEARWKELASAGGERDAMIIESHPDALDDLVSSAERDMAVLSLEIRTQLAHDIHAALDKLNKGEYGLCEDCDTPIPPKRLDAIPWARLCTQCQEALEARIRDGEMPMYEAA